MGNFLHIYKVYIATLLMRVASEMRVRLGCSSLQRLKIFSLYVSSPVAHILQSYWLHFLSLFFIPESTYLSTAAWRFNKRVAYSVMSHSYNSRQSCALSLRLCTSIRHKLPGIYFCKPKRHLLHAAPSNVFFNWSINSGPGSACFLYKQASKLSSRESSTALS